MPGDLDLDRLRAVAEAATPDRWTVTEPEDFCREPVCVEPTSISNGMVCMVGRRTCSQSVADATHIATFDPPTILRLLDRLEAAEADLEVAMDASLGRIGKLLSVNK